MKRILALVSLAFLAACSSKPIYFGHQASTEGMPGMVNGQKVNPTVKLGKPYIVDGHVYVPRYDPDYDETGLASWYGPGFHGGKTANGETYSKYDYTAAHTTLPMPSICRVTNLKNGKVVYVRVNDRGPYAGGRIIDLSRSAAEQIDLVRYGVCKVRVQYMKPETDRYIALLEQGRTPDSIDIATEVVGKDAGNDVAANTADHSRWWEFAPNANAQEAAGDAPIMAPQPDAQAAPVGRDDMQVNDLPPPQQAPAPVTQASDVPQQAPLFAPVAPPASTVVVAPAPQAAPVAGPSVTIVTPGAPVQVIHPAPAPMQDAPLPTSAVPGAPAPEASPAPEAPVAAAMGDYYVQLGSFSVEGNALSLQSRFSGVAPSVIEPYTNSAGAKMYRVRIGPFSDEAQASDMLGRAQQLGVTGAQLVKP